ncbi:MAG: zraR 7, partial [Acidobacteria bacterium]|nr:zraR 7 [Acidobacteriota bacterium]
AGRRRETRPGRETRGWPMIPATAAPAGAEFVLPADLEPERLQAFQDLLRALGGTLDVRSVFRQVSRIATRIIPHDEAALALRTEEGDQFRLYASTQGDEAPRLLCQGEHAAACDASTGAVFGPAEISGFESGLRVPVRIDGAAVGVLALLSREPDAFTDQDLALAEFLADFVAVALSHQRLAAAKRRAALERDRVAHVDASVELLRAVGSVLDIRAVFPQISAIANTVLPHDALTMMVRDADEAVATQAATPSEFPRFDGSLRLAASPAAAARGFVLVADLAQEATAFDDPDVQARLMAAGYRSMLGITAAAHSQIIDLAFWSKRAHAFSDEDAAIGRRISDYVALAVSHEQLVEAAQQVAEAKARAERLESRVHKLAAELDARSGHGHVAGKSALWMDVLKRATQVAATETTVLLTGASGTGKEVVARFVHRASARKSGPFVAINCAALPEQLLESELFGYERGAFTGAQQAKPGQIELAAGGVLFLDEVSEMSLSAQAKFLRVLQEREFQRLGGTRLQKADVRVIAATNRDLRKAVDRGAFREDLYYRLHIFDISLPPLRDRPTDIPLLADVFLEDIGRSFGRPPAGLTRDAKDALLHYGWPGNVRELRNALERAVILSEGGLITAAHLALRADAGVGGPAPTDLSVVERETIARVMQEAGGNKSRAADRLGLTRMQLYGRLRKYGLLPQSDSRAAAI